MKYWLDTEFIEFPCCIDLISIGIVAEDGRELYLVSSEFDESKASDWVKQNVISLLGDGPRFSRASIKSQILNFVGGDRPEFWGYYADYDWVVFCWLFGSMVDLPKGWPMYCRDLQQWSEKLGQPFLPAQPAGLHNALEDARWNRSAYQALAKAEQQYLKELEQEAINEELADQLKVYESLDRLKWSDEAPQQEGWFFNRPSENTSESIFWVYWDRTYKDWMCVLERGFGDSNWCSNYGGQWAGPIELPIARPRKEQNLPELTDGYLTSLLSDSDDYAVKDNWLKAVRLVQSTQKATTSLIQRRLRIGYNLSRALLDKLEAVGFVGPESGSTPRQVVIPR